MKFKVIKELPGVKVGTILNGSASLAAFNSKSVGVNFANEHPTYFELVIEDNTIDALQPGWICYSIRKWEVTIHRYLWWDKDWLYVNWSEAMRACLLTKLFNNPNKYIPKVWDRFYSLFDDDIIIDCDAWDAWLNLSSNAGYLFRTIEERNSFIDMDSVRKYLFVI